MPASNSNGVWKWICGILVTALGTGLLRWFSFGGGILRSEALQIAIHAAKSKTTRDEVVQMIETTGPYIEDRSGIRVELKYIREIRLSQANSEVGFSRTE